MIDTKKNFNNAFDSWSTKLDYIEFSDNESRAILTIPLFHVGPNKKGLFWTKEMLMKITPLYRRSAFRYDLDGKEGSSHTINKLSSPHFDVGWTYDGDEGAWFDDKAGVLWVKGEVTHPQVVEKLKRMTTDGQREVNFASMGIIVDEAKCSICGGVYEEICENGHERNKRYNMEVCYKVPTACSKGLHVALTNDPADAEAVIANCVFQELGELKMKDKKDLPSNQNLQSSPGLNNEEKTPNDGEQSSPMGEMRKQSSNELASPNNQMPNGLAPGNPQTNQPGESPSPDTILRDLAERIKTLENQVNQNQMQEGTPELVNSAPQDQMVQSNMGTTSQFEESKEENNMDVKDGQPKNEKVPVNPEETQDMNMDPMGQIMQMLEQILASLNGNAETQDINELENVKKDKIVHEEDKPMDHEEPGDQVSHEGATDEGNKKNKQHMNDPGKVATADNSEKENVEVADLKKQVELLKKRVELQSSEVPEFGGSSAPTGSVDVADMGAEGRRENFGEYGAWASIFEGADNAQRFKR